MEHSKWQRTNLRRFKLLAVVKRHYAFVSRIMKLTKIVQFSVLWVSALLVSLSLPPRQAEAQAAPQCYVIRSLNRNFQTDNRYLGITQVSLGTPVNSDGSATVQAIQIRDGVGLSQKRAIWSLTPTNKGSILTTLLRSNSLNIDGASDGRRVVLNPSRNVTHGQYWQVDRDGNGYRIRSLNNNFRNSNYRWLDGASDGHTVQLSDGKSHGTLWEFTPTRCQ